MTIRTKDQLKSKYQTGDIPDGSNYNDVFDSLYSKVDDSIVLTVNGQVPIAGNVTVKERHTIKSEGIVINDRSILNFIGDNITVADDGNSTLISVSKGLSGIAWEEITGVPALQSDPVSGVYDLSIATTSFVKTEINNLIAGAPDALDTLLELSNAISGDAEFAANMVAQMALKAPSNNPLFTGTASGTFAGTFLGVVSYATSANNSLLFDGHDSSYYATSHNPLFTGSVSATFATDADKLDGQHGSFYAPINSPLFTGSVSAESIYVNNIIGTLATIAPTATLALNSLALNGYSSSHFAPQENPSLKGTVVVENATKEIALPARIYGTSSGSAINYYTAESFLSAMRPFSFSNSFGGNGVYISELHNILYKADVRFQVTQSGFAFSDATKLFNQNYDHVSNRINNGSTATVTIDVTTELDNIPAAGGTIFVCFNGTTGPSSVMARVKDSSNTWYTGTDVRNVSKSAENFLYAIDIPTFVGGTIIEIVVTAGAQVIYLTQIEYYLHKRMGIPLPFLTKYNENSVYNSITLYNSVNSPKIVLNNEDGSILSSTVSADLFIGNLTGLATSASEADMLDGQHGSFYAPINNPLFTGTASGNLIGLASSATNAFYAPTAVSGSNNTQIANTEYVTSNAVLKSEFNDTLQTHVAPYHGVVRSTAALAALPSHITSIFTLATSANPLEYYFAGTRILVNTDQTIDFTGFGYGLWFVYFLADTGIIAAGRSFPAPALTSNIIISSVFWNGLDYGLVYDEMHSYARDLLWHAWTHKTVGTRYVSGLDIVLAGQAGGATMTVGAGEIMDEDISFVTPSSSLYPTPNAYRLFWQNSVSSVAFDTTLSTVPYKADPLNAYRPMYVNAATYVLSAAPNAANRYVNFFCYASLDKLAPIYIFAEKVTSIIAGQGGYTSAAQARAIPWPNLSLLGMAASELKPLHRILVLANGTVQAYAATDDYRSVSSLPQSAGTSSTTANIVSFVPFDGIAATNVQNAIEELSTERATLDSPLFTGTVTADRLLVTGLLYGAAVSALLSGFSTTSGSASSANYATTSGSADYATISGSASYAQNSHTLDGFDSSYFAPITSPSLSGVPTCPTPAPESNTAQIVNTAYVKTALENFAIAAASGNAYAENAGKLDGYDSSYFAPIDSPQLITPNLGNAIASSISMENLSASGNVTIGKIVYTTFNLTTQTTNPDQVLAFCETSLYRTMELTIQARHTGSSRHHTTKILAMNDNAVVVHTEYASININGTVASYGSDYVPGYMRILVTPEYNPVEFIITAVLTKL